MKRLDSYFLDPSIHFLNHGSFGACPKEIMQKYFEWVLRMETQPVKFFARDYHELLRSARISLGEYLHAPADQLVFVPNATHGVNAMMRAISLNKGDEILTSDQEYGACENAWIYGCEATGATIKKIPFPVPMRDDNEIIEQLFDAVTPQTKAIYLSHITSATAMTFPVQEICRRAKERGIITCIDGAHAPGQIPLNLSDIGADFYTGNCHKWMSAPKGSAFLYTSAEWAKKMEPVVVSWGHPPHTENTCGIPLIDYFEWTGTGNPCAALTVPDAIDYLRKNHWEEVIINCRQLLSEALDQISDLFGIPKVYANDTLYHQMAIAEIPHQKDAHLLKKYLYDLWRVEIPIIQWSDRTFVRISIQVYNDGDDVSALVQGLKQFFNK